jgi:Trp operon repressor
LADYETPSRNFQIVVRLSIVRDDLDYNRSYREIGAIFNVNKGTVHRIRSDAIKHVDHDTAALLLQPDEKANAMAFITDSFQRGSPVSPK